MYTSQVFIGHVFLNTSFAKGTNANYVMSYVLGLVPNIEKGYNSGSQNIEFNRGLAISGSDTDLLNGFNINYFIDDETANILKYNEVLPIPPLVISNSTGLIRTPQRRENILTVQSIFEPNVKLGQLVEVKADIIKKYNGYYKCLNIKHNGGIGGTTTSQLITTIELSYNKDKYTL